MENNTVNLIDKITVESYQKEIDQIVDEVVANIESTLYERIFSKDIRVRIIYKLRDYIYSREFKDKIFDGIHSAIMK